MENNSYSVKTNAGKSFRTFLLTLSVSLIIFSGVYYFLTTNASKSDNLEASLYEKTTAKSVADKTEAKTQGAVAGAVSEKTVFGEIASKESGGQARQVLAGYTQTPQTTTSAPDGGTVGVTVGLFGATIFFIVGLFIVSRNPRKLALDTFEKNITRNVEEE